MRDVAGLSLQGRAGLLGVLGLLSLLGLLAASAASADPGYYLVTPYAESGRTTLDLRYWTVKPPGRKAMLWPELGLRHGFSERWTSEFFVSGIGPSLRDQRLSSWNWQNTLRLTEGRSAWDLGLLAQWVYSPDQGHALEWGPLLQTEWGLTQLNANLLVERRWRDGYGTRLKLQLQALHRLDRGLRLGLQSFAELGRWRDSALDQGFRAGPVLRLGGAGAVEFQAAYLWGHTQRRRGDMFSAQLLYNF